MTDEKIIELFEQRDEQALRECMALYGAYCRTVASRILPDAADAEEAVADTWLAVWDAIPPQRPKYLRLFLGRITRNQAVSIWRRNNAYRRGGGETALALDELSGVVGAGSAEEMLDTKALSRSVSAFLKQEPETRRKVFVCRYFYMEEIPVIAQRYALKEPNVRMMLSRTRQKLKRYLKQEGYDL